MGSDRTHTSRKRERPDRGGKRYHHALTVGWARVSLATTTFYPLPPPIEIAADGPRSDFDYG